jgi:predicted permease
MLLRVLASAGLCLLVIACTNMASLLLTRFVARQREVALRTALGAGRERLTRQLLTESVVLAVLGGALGVALAVAATPVLARLAPINLPVPPASALDVRVLGFATLLTIATGVAFGVLPALSLWRRNDSLVLRGGERTTPGRDRFRATLIVAQVAASVLLLVSAGLLLRALVRVQSVSPGFSTEGVLTMRTTPSGERYTTTSARARFYERVVREVEALPGVQSAAYTSFTPMAMRGGIWAVEIPGVTTADSDEQVHTASLRFVTPRFFETLQVPIVEGRDVAVSDTFEAPFVAVVSESFAKRYWPGQEAVGRRFTFAFRERLIVGVVGDIRVRGLERISEPQVYLPHKQVPDGGLVFYTPKDLLIRTAGDPIMLAPSVRKVIRAADPELAISDVMPLEEVVALQMASRQTQLRVLGVFAAASLLLTGVGLHGLLAFNVAQRRKEIGVRVALGASRARVVKLVASRGITLALAGAVGGLFLANLMAVRFSDLLFGVSPVDPATYATAVGLILVVAASGSLVPALRALRVDPCAALRGD